MKRTAIWALIFSLLLSILPASALAAAAVGNLDVTVKFEYPKQNKTLTDGGVMLTLRYGEQEVLALALEGGVSRKQFTVGGQSAQAQVQMVDKDGQALTSETALAAACRVRIEGLPLGNYQAELAGGGFAQYRSDVIELNDFSKHLIVANDTASFAVGDVNGDGAVNEADLDALEDYIGKGQLPAKADLNRDGVCDLVDIAYLYNNIGVGAGALLQNTSAVPAAAVDVNAFAASLESAGVSRAQAESLLTDDTVVDIAAPGGAPVSETNPVALPVPMLEGREIQYVGMTLPESGSAPKNGTVVCELEDATVMEVPFDLAQAQKADRAALPMVAAGASLYEDTDQARQVVIYLGARVAVKKITIRITGTQDANSPLASIAKVEFLQDILPETIDMQKDIVKNVRAKGGQKSVTLNWDAMPNVTGYRVKYGEKSGDYTMGSLDVSGTGATIRDLKNGTDYYFVVCATNGDWSAPYSEEVRGVPVATSAPAKVGGVRVSEGDGLLQVSWGAAEDASYYYLYYKKENDKTWEKLTVNGTSHTLVGLTNDVTYLIQVSGANQVGEGPKSSEASGVPFKPSYEEPQGIPTFNRIENTHITNISLTHKDHYDHNIYPGGIDPKVVIDEDFSTHWTSRAWWENEGFVVTFDQAYEMDHVAWVTRLDGKYRNSLNRYYIEVWGEGDDLSAGGRVLVPFGSGMPIATTKEGVAVLPFEKSSVKQIKVCTKIYDGAPTEASCSELRFFEYYSLMDEISALFGDAMHTTLAQGVTLPKVEAYEKRVSGETGEFYLDKTLLQLELDQAKAILADPAAGSANVVPVENGRDASKDVNRGFSYTLSDLQPLGFTANANQQIIVYVDAADPAAGLPVLVATQFFGEASAWQQQIPLVQGRNVVKIPKIGSGSSERGGSLYVRYTGAAQSVRVNVLGANKTALLNLPEFTLETADAQEAAVKNAIRAYIPALKAQVAALPKNNRGKQVKNETEIATKHILLSIPADQALSGITAGTGGDLEQETQAMYHSLMAWEEMMNLFFDVAGLSDSAAQENGKLPCSRINGRYMDMSGKAFMYAGGAHFGMPYGVAGGMTKGYPSSVKPGGLFGWGVGHEIGHILDQTGLVFGETTNNIYAMYAQTHDGVNNTGTSRLEGGTYNSIYEKVSVAAPGLANNVFVQLGMFWQLHLAYDGGGADSASFYGKMYQLKRSGAANAMPDRESKLIALASDAAEKDLRPFFKQWGLPISAEVNAYLDGKGYPAETRKLYYLNDSARRYRLDENGSGMGAVSGVSVTAQQGETQKQFNITVTHSLNENDILGYEIVRGGQVVAFSTEKTYTDTIQSANNISLNYQVRIIDKLLNESELYSAPEVKIAYDGTLDSAGWAFTKDADTNKIDMLGVNSVSGFKAEAAQGGLAYTIKVGLVPDAAQARTVKTGTLAQGENTVYFGKPGADPSDTRIWTYSAQYVFLETTGAADSVTNLRLISYPGDNIEIEQGAIGVLKADYRYGSGEEDVIAAGTKIVTGSYRGDPVYNVLKINGYYTSEDYEADEENAKPQTKEQLIEGDFLLFAEVPSDGEMTNISDGFWIFILKDQDAAMPDQLKAELWRVDDPQTLAGERKVSDTIWITAPTIDTMPEITLVDGFEPEKGE